MSEPGRLDWRDEVSPQIDSQGEPHPADLLASLMRAEAGARNTATHLHVTEVPVPPPPVPIESRRPEAVPAAARALAAPQTAPDLNDAANMQRTMQTLRAALPVLQRLLPLMDSNFLGALTGMTPPVPQEQPSQRQIESRPLEPRALEPRGLETRPLETRPVDLTPVESGLTELRAHNQELRNQFHAQDAALKVIGDHLDQVREATDRNTREQDELVDELKASGKKINVVAFLGFLLLAASMAMNVILYLEIHRLVP
jgi:broad specificity phosphatase PhoE